MRMPDPTQLALKLAALSIEAGHRIMAYRQSGVEAQHKADRTVVTEADRAAEQFLIEHCTPLFPGSCIVGEEMIAEGCKPEPADITVFIDALDGTAEFVNGLDEFTVNIAVVDHGTPVLGVVYAPACGRLFIGEAGQGALEADCQPVKSVDADHLRDHLKPIMVRQMPEDESAAIAAVSRSHLDEETVRFLDDHNISQRMVAGSSMKFCVLARGDADIYPRFGKTMAWDIAAGHAILVAAGGSVSTLDGAPMTYRSGTVGLINSGFIAAGSPKASFSAKTRASSSSSIRNA